MTGPLLHVVLGTNAEHVKTAPLLHLLAARGVEHRLVDTGQHALLAARVRDDLGLRAPDHAMGGGADVDTVGQALRWSAGLATRLLRPARLRAEVFGGRPGVCLVHGDTPSTLLAALMARRAGLRLAHLESGLRSHRLLHPFPEEAVRLAVMRMSDVLFAPDASAERNLQALGVRGQVVRLGANTVCETLQRSLGEPPAPGSGPVVLTTHRVENLRSAARTSRFVQLAREVARRHDTVLVAHGPTLDTLARRGLLPALADAGVEVLPLLPHPRFARMLAAAPFVVTDGGSVQEECALLGTPTLLWRGRTERPDGLGGNVVLSGYDDEVVRRFLADPAAWRRPRVTELPSPSQQVLDVLLDLLGGPGRPADLAA